MTGKEKRTARQEREKEGKVPFLVVGR